MNDLHQSPFQRIWEEAPILRVLAPYCLGVIIALQAPHLNINCTYTATIALAALLIAAFLNKKKHFPFSALGRAIMAGTIALAMILAGITAAAIHQHQGNNEWPTNQRVWRAVVTQTPKTTNKTWMLTIRLDSAGNKRKICLHILKNNHNNNITLGQGIEFCAVISSPHNIRNNSDGQKASSFNYGRYLEQRGYSGQAFTSKNIRHLSEQEAHRIMARQTWQVRIGVALASIRDNLVKRYDSLHIDQQSAAVLAALTLGDKSLVSTHTKQTFSLTGASHILALSGLHLGILVSILMLLMWPLRQRKVTKWCLTITTIIIAWAFVVITGASISIVRSALMLSIMLLLSIRGEGFSSINNIALAAFAILIISPQSIMDVGFQMSFLAVFFIIYFLPYYNDAIAGIRHQAYRNLLSFLYITCIAQLAVAPLVAHTFGRIPLCFLLTNIIVIPCAYALLAGAILFFAFSWAPALSSLIGTVLGAIASFMTTTLAHLAHLPWSSIAVNIPLIACCLIYPLIFTTFAWLYFKQRRYAYWSILLFSLLLTTLLWA